MADQAYVFGSGVTNVQGVNSFEIGNNYSQYDIVFFSGLITGWFILASLLQIRRPALQANGRKNYFSSRLTEPL